jgi:putative peptidoglycan lipid II flippase
VVRLLAPGFAKPQRFELAVSLTRITFPYLLFITHGDAALGQSQRRRQICAAAAAAPILLNICLIAALAVAFLFPSAAYAAAWGVAMSGVLQWLLLWIAARRAGVSAASWRARVWTAR